MRTSLLATVFLFASGPALAEIPLTIECETRDLTGLRPLEIPASIDQRAVFNGKTNPIFLGIVVDGSGAFGDIKIVSSSSYMALDRAAIAAARSGRLRGPCLQHAKGRLMLRYSFGIPSAFPDAVSRYINPPKQNTYPHAEDR